MLVDIHFHSYVYSPQQLKMALKDIETHNIFLCSVTCTIEDWKKTVEITKQSERILPMFGIHPEKAPETVDDLDSLCGFMNEAFMFGEIGLDHNWVKDSAQYPAQTALLSHFLEAAERDNKPVMLHTNGAEDEVLSLLDTYSISKAVFHDYDCSMDIFKQIIDRNFFISVGTIILEEYKEQIENWESFIDLVKQIPHDLLLTETDGPPRDRRMPSSRLHQVIGRIAEVCGTSGEEIGSLGRANFLKLIRDDSRFEKIRKMVESG